MLQKCHTMQHNVAHLSQGDGMCYIYSTGVANLSHTLAGGHAFLKLLYTLSDFFNNFRPCYT
jgi:hypothetical protein